MTDALSTMYAAIFREAGRLAEHQQGDSKTIKEEHLKQAIVSFTNVAPTLRKMNVTLPGQTPPRS